MSNETFDNKIRSKFEDFEPIYQEQDWQNFAPILHPKVPFLVRARQPFAYAAVAASVIFLTYQNYQQSIENKQLQADNQALRIEKQTIVTNTTEHHDTVYLVKEIVEKPSNSAITQPKVEPLKQWTQQQNDVQKLNKPLTPFEKKELKLDGTSESKQLQNENIVISENVIQKSDNQLINNQPKEDSKVDKQLEKAYQAIIEEANKTQLAMLSTIPLPHQLFSNEPKFPVKPEREWLFASPKIITPKGSGHHFSLGVSTMLQEGSNSIGLVANYQISKHFQVSSGVAFRAEGGMHFDDDDDFRKINKVDFKKKFNQPLSPNARFTNINTCTKIVQIPVNVHYTHSIYRGISYVASAGTLLNVYSTQHFDFLYSENGNAPTPGKLPLINEGKHFLGGFVLSTGAQARWKNFTLRAEPTFVINFKGPKNGPNDDNLGFQTQLYYNF